MVIREYRCQDCDYLFDDFMIKQKKECECPVCGSQQVNIISREKVQKDDPLLLAV